MDSGLILAIYAAVVATGSLTWQCFTWWHRRRTRVKVSIRWAVAAMAHGNVEMLSIVALNDSDLATRVDGVGLDAQDDSGMQYVQVHEPFPGGLPGEVGPHRSEQAYMVIDDMVKAGLDPAKPLVAWVRLPDGREIRSARTTIHVT